MLPTAGGVRLLFDTLRLREDIEGLQRKGVIIYIGVIVSAFASAKNYTPGAASCRILQHGLLRKLLRVWLGDIQPMVV